MRRRIREALRDLGGSGSREVRKIREDVDQLRRDQQELKARLSKLEAKAESPKHKKK